MPKRLSVLTRRIRHAACRSAPVRGRGWKRAAVAAALRLRAVAGLEARRAGDAGGLRRAGRGAGRAGRRGRAGSASTMRSTGIGRSWRSRWPITSIATTSRAAISSAPAAPAHRARPRAQRGRVYAGGCRDRSAQRGAGGRFRRIRRHPDAGRARRGARGLESTGNPVFCSIWTYLGTPAITLPLMNSGGRAAARGSAGRRRETMRAPHRALACQTLQPGARRAAGTRTTTAKTDAACTRKGKAS